MKKILMVMCGVGVLSGCTIGQSDFNCSSGDGNALCGSSRTIYAATNSELAENTKLTYIQDGEPRQIDVNDMGSGEFDVTDIQTGEANNTASNGESGPKTLLGWLMGEDADNNEMKSSSNHDESKNQATVPHSFNYDGQAIRTPAKVQRIWLAPWVDKEDNLHMSSLIYTEVEPKKWEIGLDEQNSGLGIIPHKKSKGSTAIDVNVEMPMEGEYRPPMTDQLRMQQNFSNLIKPTEK